MEHNYIKEALKVLGAVIVALLLLAYVPDFEIKFKHFHVLSDIITHDPVTESRRADAEDWEEETDTFALKSDSLLLRRDSLLGADTLPPLTALPIAKDTAYIGRTDILPLEDYSPNGNLLLPFFNTLLTEADKRPVRIGVLGDSFVECDIITSELRRKLQARYGGKGVGHIPVVSPVEYCRSGIRVESSGWKTKSMIYNKDADWSKFSLTGYYYQPEEKATVRIHAYQTDSVPHLSFAFINLRQSALYVAINNRPEEVYKPASSGELQFLTFSAAGIQSLKMRVEQADGFTAIGFFQSDTTGVYVDNFSVRGSSGGELFVFSKELSRQMQLQVPHDLLILEFGLNVMTAEPTTYKSYREQMIKAITQLKRCYPNTPIVLMSVGDRGSKNADGSIASHPGVRSLVEAQRKIAQETGIVFWSTYDAMGGSESMVDFVNETPTMAAKDYTHINARGGVKIARKLYESLMSEQNRFAP